MAIHARALLLLSTQLVDLLERSHDGVIVNICSEVDHKGYVNQGAYTSSKHALSGLTKVLAKELQPRGIRVHPLSRWRAHGNGVGEQDKASDARVKRYKENFRRRVKS